MTRDALDTGPSDERWTFSAEVIDSLAAVKSGEWDALVGPDDPFTEHRFLRALEDSHSVGERTGWYPRHLLLRDRSGTLVGALPLYLKDNSYGEYIFDWGWADAALSAGIPYYPKLVAAVPFTPVTGQRLLVPTGEERGEIQAALLVSLQELAEQLDVSSAHLLFVTDEERALLERFPAYLPRLTYQFRWDNVGYASFGEYLGTFRNATRKSVRRERQRVAESGLAIHTLRGEELCDAHWDALYAFYHDTTGRKWGQRYLTRRFFELLRERLADRVVVTLALEGQRAVAGALSFHKGACLYGRYWGCLESYDGLHFELCYYRPIELCIERGYTRFEAGAQGAHKLKRGLLPQPTHSAHLLRSRALHQAVARYLTQEARATRQEMAHLAEHGPFRRACQQ